MWKEMVLAYFKVLFLEILRKTTKAGWESWSLG
jgi:hypothetical protein